MEKQMEFTAVCAYPGLEKFRFYSSSFFVSNWSDVEKVGAELVRIEWAKISPHEPPQIIDYLPGALHYISTKA